jgi:hypothetical protein
MRDWIHPGKPSGNLAREYIPTEYNSRKYYMHNPSIIPLKDLSPIYAFDFTSAVIIPRLADDEPRPVDRVGMVINSDGHILFMRTCSSEAFMPNDLHCHSNSPIIHSRILDLNWTGGYRMEFIPGGWLKIHEPFQLALECYIDKYGEQL